MASMAQRSPQEPPRIDVHVLRASMTVKPRGGLGALGVVVLLAMIAIMAGAFLIPIAAPQGTCDGLAPILGC
jgi:hypothetical protein